MKEKQRTVLDDLLLNTDERYRAVFLELAEYAVSLGYNPVRNKTHDVTIDFRNNNIKKTIMKMEAQEQKHISIISKRVAIFYLTATLLIILCVIISCLILIFKMKRLISLL